MQRYDRLTTEQILTATRTTREQLYLWIAQKLLPRPVITTTPSRTPIALWPHDTPARVRLILAKLRAGYAPADIHHELRQRWPATTPMGL
ncbi:MAG: hypothetical protein IPO88_07950 [Nannocystis sp.]|uniref:hypothetical protein n=1 Tax=Nannocystis sp. TaxID=1962667 RepID=UPI00242648FC|nr:hypothetical protein [Nannocystis sp.]MBK9753427.1 hypothetical protein [Nannocystis sp.]